jgi:hypothetical protein
VTLGKSLGSGYRYRVDHSSFPGFGVVFVANLSVNKRVQRVVFANAYVIAGTDWCSALTYKDCSCGHVLTTETLDAESL